MFSEEDGWDVVQDIPDDTAAALVLIEHHWAVPLRDAIMRAGGFRISDGFISPLDLVEIGLDRRRGGRRAARDRGRRRPLTGRLQPTRSSAGGSQAWWSAGSAGQYRLRTMLKSSAGAGNQFERRTRAGGRCWM